LKKFFIYLSVILVFASLWAAVFNVQATVRSSRSFSTENTSEKLDSAVNNKSLEAKPTPEFPSAGADAPSGIQLKNPSNIKSKVDYDPETREYIFVDEIGNIPYRRARRMTLSEYQKYDLKKSTRDYWQQKSNSEGEGASRQFAPSFKVGGEAFDKIFGSNTINIVPQGSAELIFGYNVNRIDNPTLSEKLRRTPTFNFEQKIQMNVTGTIGERVKLGINYNTEATFEFENKTKLDYTGHEDQIIKKIEAGNVTLPLTGSLITGSQSLFGIKTELQFGKLFITSVASQQKGQTQVVNVEGGAMTNKFEVMADQYEVNKHFFLNHYFRDRYDAALENLPTVISEVTITEVEVWITNKSGNFNEYRNIIAFADLGENKNITNTSINPQGANDLPYNETNDLYDLAQKLRSYDNISSIIAASGKNLTLGKDYEIIESARKLTPREYSFDPNLGYISLNFSLNSDEVLAVAYKYTTPISNDVLKVGEFANNLSTDSTLVLRLLKGTNLTPRNKHMWNLMMKNIYSLGAYQISREDFLLNILYQNDRKGIDVNYMPEDSGSINKDVLLKVMNLDSLNIQNEKFPDGQFDFVEGRTLISSTGRVIFPVIEPFGKGLENYFDKKYKSGAISIDMKNKLISKYVYRELYDSTLTKARLIAEKNKFKIAGTYKSSSGSEIFLNAMNIPQGSVKVTAGGVQLQENADFTVDYNLGRVKIINQGLLQSGNPIQVSLESQSLFNFQTKTLVGSDLKYKYSDNLVLGGTILRLNERPLTQKVNFGTEPISNTIWGLNAAYQTEVPFLTYLVDKIPFIETKEASNISFSGEFAQIIPGSAKAIGKEGVSYIDDFEGSETTIEMKSFPSWYIASTPFPIASKLSASDKHAPNFRRAKLSWFVIDPLFLRNNNLTPTHIKNNDAIQKNHFVREVEEKEIFRNKQTPNNLPTTIPVLNLTYYPKERGPYNFTTNYDSNGNLSEPEENWAGIMREVQTPDFESANVEYIEFWLMDPFVYKKQHKGGQLVFNLGDVSEDILKDSRKSFENGLPAIGENKPLIDSTAWGKVPKKQSVVNAFDNNPQSRLLQDVGLDGLNNEEEATWPYFQDFLSTIKNNFGENSPVYNRILQDPSGDDYHYFRGGDFDNEQVGILDRYKKYNGLEANSPASEQSTEEYPTAASTLPNNEDINRDYTLSMAENYFEYSVDLKPEDLVIGSNFITDKVTSSKNDNSGIPVDWYQFKIPVAEFTNIVGSIEDFKSIRFLRMYLTGFEDTVICRFGKLELVRGEWRKYNRSMIEAGEYLANQPSSGIFDVTAVNIEKNAGREPINYVLPPGIDRVIDPTNPQIRMLNEQAMLMKVTNLDDGDARAVYKNLNLDIRQFKYLKMFVHGEVIEESLLKDNEVTVFIRLGSDYKDNFYEYEVPLKLTQANKKFDNNNDADRLLVWPTENDILINLEKLTEVKSLRNESRNQLNEESAMRQLFSILDGNKKISVRGNPNLANVRTIMLGIRNPGDNDPRKQYNDKQPKSAVVWLNELRLTDFNDKSGWAANARMQTKLADFGTISLATSTIQPGFGSIEKKVNERAKEATNQYDASGNFELGKFFKEDANVRLPLFASYSTTIITPEYNPIDPDIKLKQAMDDARTEKEKENLKKATLDITTRKSINMTNMKIGQPSDKSKFYSISNWSASAGYSETFMQNISVESSVAKNYRAGVAYIFTTRPKNIAPLKKIKFLNKKYLALISDFNFYYMPQSFSFRTDVNRNYKESQMRNINDFNNPFPSGITIDPTFYKDFIWTRMYDFKFDLTRALKFDFSATNYSRIEERYDELDYISRYKDNGDWRAEFNPDNKKVMNESFQSGGTTTKYNHTANATYMIPINKLPMLDFVSSSIRYGSTYGWDRNPIQELGNTINNSNAISLSNQLNLITLYNKVPILRRINQPSKAKKPAEKKTVVYTQEIRSLKAGTKRSIKHGLKTSDTKTVIKDATGKEVKGTIETVDDNKIAFTPDEDVQDINVLIEGKVDKKPNPIVVIANATVRTMMSVRNISVNYTRNQGTTLPGYNQNTHLFGMNSSFKAPTVPFIVGWQDRSIHEKAAGNDWLTSSAAFNTPLMFTNNERIDLRSQVEPFTGLKIDVIGNWNYTENESKLYKNINGQYLESANKKTGNFSMTTIAIGSSFEKLSKGDNYTSLIFEEFRENRKYISYKQGSDMQKLESGYILGYDSAGYAYGYGNTSQSVLIPAFFGSYTEGGIKKSPRKNLQKPSILMLLPNWRVTFDGLSKLDIIKKYFRSVTLNHGYTATYNIGSFISNNEYRGDLSDIDLMRNFYSQYEIASVSISEQFSPLIGIDMAWKNSFSTKVEYKQSRNLNLTLSNSQLSEMKSREFVVGLGYRFQQVPFIFKTQGGSKTIKSDMNTRIDFSVRDDKTILRKLTEDYSNPSAGKIVYTIKFNADYQLSDRFTLRFFYDRIINNPFVSNSFRTSNSNLGFSLRFMLVN